MERHNGRIQVKQSRWEEEVQTLVPWVAQLGQSNYSLFCGWCSIIM